MFEKGIGHIQEYEKHIGNLYTIYVCIYSTLGSRSLSSRLKSWQMDGGGYLKTTCLDLLKGALKMKEKKKTKKIIQIVIRKISQRHHLQICNFPAVFCILSFVFCLLSFVFCLLSCVLYKLNEGDNKNNKNNKKKNKKGKIIIL